MPPLSEILNALIGAYHLAWRDTAGYQFFNNTVEGFWRSFTAALVVAPMLFILATPESALQAELDAARGEAADAGVNYARMAVALALDWISYPIVMVFVARALNLSHRYALYIIALNWSAVLILAALNVPLILFWAGIVGATTTVAMNFLLLFPALYYRWFIALTALDTNGPTAAGLVVMEFAIGLLVLRATLWMFG
ncbi:MAG: hypothetical protein ACR2PM_05355 [Hyphomicrobiales bacterium]